MLGPLTRRFHVSFHLWVGLSCFEFPGESFSHLCPGGQWEWAATSVCAPWLGRSELGWVPGPLVLKCYVSTVLR